MIEKHGEEIKIPLSKTKGILITLGSLAFFALGILNILYFADKQTEYDPIHFKIISAGVALFFLWNAFKTSKKLKDKGPGLILNQKGIMNNSNNMGAITVLWNDITEIEVEEVHSNRFLLLQVKNPEHYLEAIKDSTMHKIALLNQSNHGTPIVITSVLLKCRFKKLEELVRSEWMKSKQKGL